MKVRQAWKQTTLANKLMVITTAIVAFGTIFYVVVAVFQWRMLKESSEQATQQTDKLIVEADRIANTAVTAVNEAKKANEEAANRAERAIRANEKLAAAAKSQAETSRITAVAAESWARAAHKSVEVTKSGITVANRAYVSIDKMRFLNSLEANKPTILIFEFVNDGNSPAELTGSSTFYVDTSLHQCDYGIAPAFEKVVIAPKSPRTQRVIISQKGLPQTDVDDVRQGKKYFQICIKADYTTLNENYEFENCSYYSSDMNTFLECKKTGK